MPIFTNPTKPCVSGTTFFDTSKKWRHYCTVRTLLRNRPNGCSVKPFFAASQKSASRCHENSGFAKMDKRHASGDPFFNHLKKGAPRSSRLLIFVNPTFSSQRGNHFYQKNVVLPQRNTQNGRSDLNQLHVKMNSKPLAKDLGLVNPKP